MIMGIQISSLAPLMKTAGAFEECVRRLTDMGYKFTQLQWIDPSVTPEEISGILKKYGMISLGTQEKYDALVERLESFIEINRCAGSSDICFSTIPERYFQEKSLDEFILEMKKHVDSLNGKGLCASFHPTRNDFRKINGKYACDRLFESLPELMIVPDTNQLLRAGVDIGKWLLKYKGRMRMIHFKDMTDLSENAKLVPVGQGITDFKSMIGAIEESGIEYVLCEQEKWEGDPFDRMRESYEYTVSILKELS